MFRCIQVLKMKMKVFYKIIKMKLPQTEPVGKKYKKGLLLQDAPLHNIFKDISGLTEYTKKDIIKGKVNSA